MISKDKTYRTRDGREVRIYATDAGGLFPVHGAILCDGLWIGMKWTLDGHTHFTQNNAHISIDDLAEMKPRHKRTVWLNVFEGDGGVAAFTIKDAADKFNSRRRIGCIRVDLDFEEGEGL